MHIPSMRTRSVSFRMLMVENRTRMENRNVQIGSASFHSGYRAMNNPITSGDLFLVRHTLNQMM